MLGNFGTMSTGPTTMRERNPVSPLNRVDGSVRARSTGRILGFIATSLVLITTSCTADPGPAAEPAYLTIAAFTASATNTTSPALVTLNWNLTGLHGQSADCEITSTEPDFEPVSIPLCNLNNTTNVTATSDVAASHTFTLTATASLGVVATATRTFAVGAPTGEAFNITLSGLDSIDSRVASAATAAAARWEQVIVSGFEDTTTFPSWCDGIADYPMPSSVDDLFVHVELATLDGLNGTLAEAGPDCVVMPGERGVTGTITVDVDDVEAMDADGTLASTLMHEMGHVLGIGTLWENGNWGSRHLLVGTGTSDPRFKGQAATSEWRALGGSGFVPLESGGGAGTTEAHWSESAMDIELMTGWIETGAPSPLSTISIAALADLGYNVDLSVADSFSLPGAAARGWAMLRPERGMGSDVRLPQAPFGR